MEIYVIATITIIALSFLIPFLCNGMRLLENDYAFICHFILISQIALLVGYTLHYCLMYMRGVGDLGVLTLAALSVGFLGGCLVGQRVGISWNR